MAHTRNRNPAAERGRRGGLELRIPPADSGGRAGRAVAQEDIPGKKQEFDEVAREYKALLKEYGQLIAQRTPPIAQDS